jgi:NADH-quinone oxidoreductase subunit G
MSANAVPMSQWPSDFEYTIPVAGDQDLVTVTIDGTTVQAPRGELLIRVAQQHGTYIPRFCYHERMKPVGMCRMCLVEVETMRGLQISCATPVVDGMVVHTQSPAVKEAQDGVLEFLLINHPLDCPVCDRGGECPLQDQTLAFGPGESRYIEEKRHFEKPISISDLVLLDRERCIQCGRCTRFAAEIAAEPLIDFGGRGGATEVITYPDAPFSSYFSGNVVQICPVGALTSRPYRFRARPWDLEATETSCQSCSMACRGALESASNRLVRLLGVDSEPVNQGWLCDKGRYGYEWVHSDTRVRAPMLRHDGNLVEVTWPEALDAASAALGGVRDEHGAESIAVLGGASGTNEDAYLWARLAKSVLGTDHVDAQLGDGLPAEVLLGMPRATVADLDRAKAIVVLGVDVRELVPVLHLRLHRAAEELGVPLIDVGPRDSGLTRDAVAVMRHAPGAPGEAVDRVVEALRGRRTRNRAADAVVDAITDRTGPVVVVVGRPSVAEGVTATVHAAAALCAVGDVKFISALPRGNVHGALDLGLAPGFLPGRVTLDAGRDHVSSVWGDVPARAGKDAAGILRAAAAGEVKALVLLGCDPLVDFPDRTMARAALEKVERVICVGAFPTDGVEHADVVLPPTVWGEQPGSASNLEGRVVRLSAAASAEGAAMEPWRIAAELALRLGHDFDLESVDEVQDEIARAAPAFAGVDAALLRRARDGVVLPLADHLDEVEFGAGLPGAGVSWEPIPPHPDAPDDTPAPAVAPAPPVALHAWWGEAEPPPAAPTDAYSLRLVAAPTLFGSDRIVVASPSLAKVADENVRLLVNARDLDALGVSDGERVRATSSRGSIEVAIRADAATPRGTAFLASNRAGPGAADLIDLDASVTDLRLETLGTT